MTTKLTVFPHTDLETGKRSFPEGWTIVEGEPEATVLVHYASSDGSALAGLWGCSPGAFEVVYTKWEFCHLLSGSCVITPEGSPPVGLNPGDAFVLEPGFAGRWEIIETMTKHFVFKIDK